MTEERISSETAIDSTEDQIRGATTAFSPTLPPSQSIDWFDQETDLELPHRGDVIAGTIVSIAEKNIVVDIGAKSEGIIPPRELESMTSEERAELTVGNTIPVFVSSAKEGNIILSVRKAQEEQDWGWAEELASARKILQSEICGYNKGGVLVKVGHLRGFVPGSQLDANRPRRAPDSFSADQWAQLVGTPIRVKIIELNKNRNRLILSEREALREWRDEQREHLLADLREGDILEGTVSNLVNFGAFVDLGGTDGLVHLSELSWKRISHPRQVVSVGDKVTVYVLNVDRERKRIGLSLKRLDPDPWSQVEEILPVGSLIESTITNLTNFGAFARPLDMEEIEGLVHVSEISNEHISHPRDVLEKGEKVTVRVIAVDSRRRRLALSIKQVVSDEYVDLDWI